MCLSDFSEQPMDGLSNPRVWLVDTSDQLWNDLEPCVDADALKPFRHCCTDFVISTMGEP